MATWAKAPAPRHQLVLISQTLDDLVATDHPVRLLDAFLRALDWRLWEARYDGHRGQPPIHPRLMAGAILYGLIKRIRSSRDLEEATRERLDFQWLLGARTIDHATVAGFRTRFEKELKELNKEISRALVRQAGAAELVEMILDGTRVRANSDRHGARTAETIEKLVAACVEQLDQKLAQLGQGDVREEELGALRGEIERISGERDHYRAALEEARRRDAIKREIYGEKSTAVRMPLGDLDSTILPNKEGGFAPNYTPTVAVEGHSGAIVSADVVSGGDEGQAVVKTIEDCREVLGQKPDRIVADSGFASGENLEELETEEVESYMPTGADLSEKNPANRPDPTLPVDPQLWPKLPRHGKQLDSSAFLYDAENDRYYCPMGQPLIYTRQGTYQRTGISYRTYVCPGKAGCPLADQCVKGDAGHRSVARDQYQDVRDRVARRMASEAGRAIYRRRAPAIEGVFGVIKHALGIRYFLLRGLRKVRIEWNWVCGAYNIKKMLGLMQPPARGVAT